MEFEAEMTIKKSTYWIILDFFSLSATHVLMFDLNTTRDKEMNRKGIFNIVQNFPQKTIKRELSCETVKLWAGVGDGDVAMLRQTKNRTM